MTTKLKLEQIRDLAISALAELDTEPEIPPSNWEVPVSNLVNESGYPCEPLLAECANGDILCLYRHGTLHVNNGARLDIKRSSDRGLTWGAAQVVQSISGRDCRNASLGVTPTGRLIAMNRSSNEAVTDKRWKHISDDNGLTWTTTEFTTLSTLPNHVPFGRMMNTANGLMQVFYNTNHIVALFSTDNGDTWGSMVTIYQHVQTSAQFSEPCVVDLDQDRLVILFRDNVDKGRYWYCKSSDGGLTWGSAAAARWSSGTGTYAAPPNACIHNGNVHVYWDGRNNYWSQYKSVVNAEDFWNNPAIAWSDFSIVYTSTIKNGTAHAADYGYVYQIPLNEGVLRAWYDSKSGNLGSGTKILVASN